MKRSRKTPEYLPSNWTTEQDCFLIENSEVPIEELKKHLAFSFDEDTIQSRKEILGLSRRQRQMRKFLNT